MTKFKQEVLRKMKTDPYLFAAVANEMKVMPTSLPMIIDRNGNSLNQYSIVTLVASHLGLEPDELVEEKSKEDKLITN